MTRDFYRYQFRDEFANVYFNRLLDVPAAGGKTAAAGETILF